MTGRRHFLKTLAVGTAGLAVCPWGSGRVLAGGRPEPLALTRLSDDLVIITGAGGNVAALSAPEGVLLVDCGSSERAHDLLKALAALPGGRHVHTVFNTHWHWDHTGGNELVRQAGAKIIAHENTRLWLGTPIFVEWQNRSYAPRPAQAWPTQTFYTSGSLSFGGESIEYGYLPQAHTDGDIYVYFRKQNVLLAGCVLAVPGSYPILDYSTGGWIGGMADATQKLLSITDDKTRIVPGVGPVQTRADLAAEHEMLTTLKEDLWQLMRKGYGADDMIAADPTHKFDARWGKPDQFIASVYRGLYAHVRELRGVV